jgi:hypothetical protein
MVLEWRSHFVKVNYWFEEYQIEAENYMTYMDQEPWDF